MKKHKISNPGKKSTISKPVSNPVTESVDEATHTLLRIYKDADWLEIPNKITIAGRQFSYSYALNAKQAKEYKSQLIRQKKYNFRAVKKKHGKKFAFIFYVVLKQSSPLSASAK